MNKKTKAYGIISAAFIAAVCIILCLFYTLPFRGQKDVSEEEQRTLQHVPRFSVHGFLAGTYQKQAEDAIADQLLFSAQIKYGVKQVFNTLTARTAEAAQHAGVRHVPASPHAAASPSAPRYTYTEVVKDKLYKLDDSGYIVQKHVAPEKFDCTAFYEPDMLARVTYPKYLYFINTSVSIDFNHIDGSAFEYVKEQFPGMTGYADLSFTSYDEYKQLFYQTDHHWNYRGSYLGYTQIMRMMEGKDVKLLAPYAEHTYDTIYSGSLARDNLLTCSTEKFTVYLFHIPPYTTYVDDEQAPYGYRSLYVSDADFPRKKYSNHYGMYYGDDHAKVVYSFGNPQAESILILATSFSNAVNDLIASHYNETHVLDFRYYYKKYGSYIDAQSYMTQHHLSKLLIIGDLGSLGHEEKQ